MDQDTDVSKVVTISPESMEAVLVPLGPKIADLIVSSPESFNAAAEELAVLKKMGKALEASRVEEVDPHNTIVKSINAKYKVVSEKIVALVKVIEGKITGYQARIREEEERKRKEAEKAQRKAEADAEKKGLPPPIAPLATPPLVDLSKTAATSVGAVSMVDNWKWDLEDLERVPRKYLTTNDAMITRMVKAGERKIPGLRIHNEPTSRVR